VDASNETFHVLKMQESGMQTHMVQTVMELSGWKQSNISHIENTIEWNASVDIKRGLGIHIYGGAQR